MATATSYNKAWIDALKAALEASIALKADKTYVDAQLANKADTSHTHAQADVTGLVSALSAKADTTAVTAGLATKANSSHTHAQSDITGLATSLAAKADSSAVTAGLATKADATVVSVESGLTALSAATGITGSSTCGVRRVGQMVELCLDVFVLDSISVPTSGNVGNRLLFNAVATKYRPKYETVICGGMSSGRAWTGYIATNGTIYMATVSPTNTATGSETLSAQSWSGSACFPAADAG
jgi:hypothetical protein